MPGHPSRTASPGPLALLLAALTAVAGCDRDPAPAPPAVPATTSGPLLPPPPSILAGTPQVDLILPARTDPSLTAWERAGRRQAAAENALFEARTPGPDGRPTQADLIRQALASGTDAILIVPGTDERGDLDQAIQEARAASVPVLSVLEPLRAGGAALPVVTRGDYLPLARELVQALVDDCKTLGRPASGPALVVVNETATDHRARADALMAALAEAGVEVVDGAPRTFVVDYKQAGALISRARESQPDLPMVLVTDDVGFRAAATARNEIKPADRFVLAGFGSDHANTESVTRSFASALAYGPEGGLGKAAVEQVLAALRRGEPPSDIVVPSRLLRAPNAPSMEMITADLARGVTSEIPALIPTEPDTLAPPPSRAEPAAP